MLEKLTRRIFLNNSSLGLYPAIVRQREDYQKKGRGKWRAFAVASFQALRRYQHLYVRMRLDDQPEIQEETPFVFIGNNQYEVCGFQIGQRNRLDAGKLWVYRAPNASRATLFRLGVRALCGRQEPGELAVSATNRFCIQLQKTHVHVATDGEVKTMFGPLNYSILPKALSVIVPIKPAAFQTLLGLTLRTIAHISDLHFGRVNCAILPALTAAIQGAKPDVVVVSGDLTQRARSREFAAAREFLETLPKPQIVVPGNHDVPLYNIFKRWWSPLQKYRRYINEDVEPFFVDDEIAILAINTARSLTFKNGRINALQVAKSCDRLNTSPQEVTRILVTHHRST